MKAIEAERNGNKCPACGGRTTIDWKLRGWVRHRWRVLVAGIVCTHGRKEKNADLL
jgi:hypothetical protein